MLPHRFHSSFRISAIEMLNNALVFIDDLFHVALDGIGQVTDPVKMGLYAQNCVPNSFEFCSVSKATVEQFVSSMKAPEVAAL